MRPAIALLLLAACVAAQTPVAPTPDAPEEINTHSGYTTTSSFEVGYRFADVGGNRDVYRASVNYGNGARLFEGRLRINSVDGQGGLFDEFSLRTFGAATDPYQSSALRVEKNALYRYEMDFRLVRYFNQLPSLWAGERGRDSERIFQTHDLTLFPGSRLELLFGYDRNKQTGPGFATEGIPSSNGAFRNSNFLRFEEDLLRVNNNYRAGVNFRALGLAVTAIQSFDNYKEDTRFGDASGLDRVLDNVQAISQFRREEPFHGNTPVTTVAVRSEKERRIGVAGRFVYSSGNRNSILAEELTATNAAATQSTLRQTFILGGASRKQGSGDFTVTLLPSPKWTLSNTTAANNTRISGGSDFVEISAFTDQRLQFEDLAIRYITNAGEASYRPVKQFSVYGAYRFSTRRVRTSEAFEFPGFRFETPLSEVDNKVHAGAGGVRWMPVRGVRASFDVEIGRADQPLTPISEKNFHNETARLLWRGKGATLTAHFKNKLNNNPTRLLDYSSESRSGGLHGSWADPDGRLTLDGGYTYLSLDTSAGIFNLFDFESEEPAAARTFYQSRLHTGNFGARFAPHERLAFYLGYAISKDIGDGRGSLSSGGGLTPTYPSFSFDGANFFVAFPLTYQSPQARLSLTINERLSWNFGWQFYNYSERFSGLQNYHAHVGYSSFRWSF